MKLITFVVPCYNSQDYMHICLNSLLTAGDQCEILIINDGSTDRTGKIAADYERRYPEIVRVLTQENSGHGEGINHGLREAEGKYFKVVDSDDWLDPVCLSSVLQQLELCDQVGGIDMMICNYVYDVRGGKNRVIKYHNVFPEGRIFGWDETKHFAPSQYLTMHSCLHRTEVLRESRIILPKHTFYEDNLFAYSPLPLVKKMFYVNVNLYHNLIGQSNQLISEMILKGRCSHQIAVSTAIFRLYDMQEMKKTNKKLAAYMYHETVFMMSIATIFTRINRTRKAEAMVQDMWDNVSDFDQPTANKIRYCSIAAFMNLPGKLGSNLAILFYRMANQLVHFNSLAKH